MLMIKRAALRVVFLLNVVLVLFLVSKSYSNTVSVSFYTYDEVYLILATAHLALLLFDRRLLWFAWLMGVVFVFFALVYIGYADQALLTRLSVPGIGVIVVGTVMQFILIQDTGPTVYEVVSQE
jgi:hypothetical protein